MNSQSPEATRALIEANLSRGGPNLLEDAMIELLGEVTPEAPCNGMSYEDAVEAKVTRAQACGELRRHRMSFSICSTSIIIKDVAVDVHGQTIIGEHEIRADSDGLYNGGEVLAFLGY